MQFVTRFGKVVKFEPKPKVWKPLPRESFFETAMRIYYPKRYKKNREMRDKQDLELMMRAW